MVKRSNSVGEGEAVAAAAARGEAVTAEIGVTASGGPEERPGGRLSCCMQSIETGMSGAWATPRMLTDSIFDTPKERIDLSPIGDKVFLHVGQVRVWEHVDQMVPGERLKLIAANQVDCKRLWFVGQGDTYGAIIAKEGASTQSNGVYAISPHACGGVARTL